MCPRLSHHRPTVTIITINFRGDQSLSEATKPLPQRVSPLFIVVDHRGINSGEFFYYEEDDHVLRRHVKFMNSAVMIVEER